MFSKLDRILGNEKRIEKFPIAEAMFITKGVVDHTPVSIRVHKETTVSKTPFKYFHMGSVHING